LNIKKQTIRGLIGSLKKEELLFDLPEIGSQGVVCEILQENRSFSMRQIRTLAKRFHMFYGGDF